MKVSLRSFNARCDGPWVDAMRVAVGGSVLSHETGPVDAVNVGTNLVAVRTESER